MASIDDLWAVKAWDALNQEEPDARNVEEGILAPCAAEDLAEKLWADGDCAEETIVCVRCVDGAVRTYSVEAERTVSFRATETSVQPVLPGLADK